MICCCLRCRNGVIGRQHDYPEAEPPAVQLVDSLACFPSFSGGFQVSALRLLSAKPIRVQYPQLIQRFSSQCGVLELLFTHCVAGLMRFRLFTLASRPYEEEATMAQKIQTLFIDDLDGSEAEGTIRFGLDGAEYEIDLNAEHAQALRDALARYVGAARRAAGSARRPVRNGRRATSNGLNPTEVREWARSQGIEVKDRGRVPAELMVKFKASTAN